MHNLFDSNQFLITTIVLDVLFLAALNTVIPVQPTTLIVAFVLLILSPGLAYLIGRFAGNEV